jgi:uncharacterized protein
MTPRIPTSHEIETYSGGFLDVSNPRVEDIALEDIAHALSNICRYGGHCKTFYSVAEHAVFVSKRLERQGEPRHVQLAGLHHDDSEYALSDIPRPLKPLLGKAYERLTDRMDAAICKALGGPPWLRPEDFHAPQIKAADTWALMVEARHLLPSEGRLWFQNERAAADWDLTVQPSRIVIPDYWYGGFTPDNAEKAFIARHKELTR